MRAKRLQDERDRGCDTKTFETRSEIAHGTYGGSRGSHRRRLRAAISHDFFLNPAPIIVELTALPNARTVASSTR